METLIPNIGKNLDIEFNNKKYQRLPVKTHVVMAGEDIVSVVKKYTTPHFKIDDYIFISERIVAIAQGRAFPISEIHPSKLANFLVRFVHKSPHGIGLGSPWTMELALREAGVFRILLGAFISAITKPFGLRGIFYHIVGNNINAIDGPCEYTLPPYNGYAKLGPKDPDKVAKQIQIATGHEVIIIDANDLGVNILGRSSKKIDVNFCKAVFKDNPLGQSKEQTPVCIVREV